VTLRELIGLSTPEARVLGLGGGVAVLAVVGPSRLSRLPSPCLVRRLFGGCPVCGATRAVAALARGDVSRRPRRGLGAVILLTSAGIVAGDVRSLWSRRASRPR
jgi:hypothetical protein